MLKIQLTGLHHHSHRRAPMNKSLPLFQWVAVHDLVGDGRLVVVAGLALLGARVAERAVQDLEVVLFSFASTRQ
jgi:hypothetical protein